MGYAYDYATAIMHRGRVMMEPIDFVPNWPDQPRKGKYFPGVETFPLSDGSPPGDATVQDGLKGLAGAGQAAALPFDLPFLASMLQDSYGLVGRRLGVQANTDLRALPTYATANWNRGTASGGGLYPVGVYWICGPSGPMPPGVYYYSTKHHAMQRLLTGDVTSVVRAALGDRAGQDTDQFLVLGVKYWQNAFKYNSFSFHAVTMDVGTIVQTWRLWAGARGRVVEPELWFDEPRIADLLGVPNDQEGIFAVVPLAWDSARGSGGVPARVSVRHRDQERSRTVLTFDTMTKIHAGTVEGARTAPAAGQLADAAAHPPQPGRARVELPPPLTLDAPVRAALRRRRSSFGRFAAKVPLTADQLGTALAASARAPFSDAASGAGAVRLTKLYAFVNHVDGVPPGAYEYDPAGHALYLVKAGPPGLFLQRNYFLANYNLEQAGVVIVPTVRTTAVLDAVGDRGYRLVNATIGAVSQNFYTAAAALDVGAGVALGFDNISFIEELDLAATGEAPLLIMLLGHERARPADFRYDIA
ncbi:nitroreductase family protein [Micromonospora sp. NBC_01813]|uniref:nitroreductase family protein n=1 Tax=Micromonospora sp. NBC_01813 TaxID=2975988 RepID=UPI002DD97EAA|nr:nitroreductase family protein [Micromonospora sp. NBC_01813]WSA07809.1 nitroreductase family protein [Micromonospora sp. NBC_01813]